MSFIESFKEPIRELLEEKKPTTEPTGNSPSIKDKATHVTQVLAEVSSKDNEYDTILIDRDVLDVLLSSPQFNLERGDARAVIGYIYNYPIVYDNRVNSPKAVNIAMWTDSTAERFK